MGTRPGFHREPDRPPQRPSEIRLLTFDDAWDGLIARGSQYVVPVERIEPGDRQAGAFTTRGQRLGQDPPLALDRLAAFASVESIVGGGPVVLRTPLASVRELIVARTDDETLSNLPNLERLSVGLAIDKRPFDATQLAVGLQQLSGPASTYGGARQLARFTSLWRLSTTVFDESVEPVAALTSLRVLRIVAEKGLRHLGKLEALEELTLKLEGGSLANLRAFGGLRRLRLLEISGRAVDAARGGPCALRVGRADQLQTGRYGALGDPPRRDGAARRGRQHHGRRARAGRAPARRSSPHGAARV